MPNVPASRPRMSTAELADAVRCVGYEIGSDPLVVVGIRGYYSDTMGAPGLNDRGIYDDALFIHAQDGSASFNGNTDPSYSRPGEGTGGNKGMACLIPGVWRVHRFALHKGQYLALCQRAGPVTVQRDGNPPYLHTGDFGINIHRGGFNTTSSEGCQTVHPGQWESFIALATDLARRIHGDGWKSAIVPYVLIDAPGVVPVRAAPEFSLAERPEPGRSGIPSIPGYKPDSGGLALRLACGDGTLGALGVFSWSPGDGNDWTTIHADATWGSTGSPIPIPVLPPGSRLYWVVALTPSDRLPADVAATIVLSQGTATLDTANVAGAATGTALVQDHRTYDL